MNPNEYNIGNDMKRKLKILVLITLPIVLFAAIFHLQQSPRNRRLQYVLKDVTKVEIYGDRPSFVVKLEGDKAQAFVHSLHAYEQVPTETQDWHPTAMHFFIEGKQVAYGWYKIDATLDVAYGACMETLEGSCSFTVSLRPESTRVLDNLLMSGWREGTRREHEMMSGNK